MTQRHTLAARKVEQRRKEELESLAATIEPRAAAGAALGAAQALADAKAQDEAEAAAKAAAAKAATDAKAKKEEEAAAAEAARQMSLTERKDAAEDDHVDRNLRARRGGNENIGAAANTPAMSTKVTKVGKGLDTPRNRDTPRNGLRSQKRA